MKLRLALLAALIAAPVAQAATIATYQAVDHKGNATYIVLTDDEATAPECNDGLNVKQAKVAVYPVGSHESEFYNGCWLSDGAGEVSVVAMPTRNGPGGYLVLDTAQFTTIAPFQSWVFDELGHALVNYQK